MLRIFALCSWKILVCSFLIMSLSGFGFRVMLASQNKSGSVPSASIFLEEIVENWYHLFLKCWLEVTSETIWTSFFPCFCFGRLIIDSISLVDTGLFRWSISFAWVLVVCVFMNSLGHDDHVPRMPPLSHLTTPYSCLPHIATIQEDRQGVHGQSKRAIPFTQGMTILHLAQVKRTCHHPSIRGKRGHWSEVLHWHCRAIISKVFTRDRSSQPCLICCGACKGVRSTLVPAVGSSQCRDTTTLPLVLNCCRLEEAEQYGHGSWGSLIYMHSVPRVNSDYRQPRVLNSFCVQDIFESWKINLSAPFWWPTAVWSHKRNTTPARGNCPLTRHPPGNRAWLQGPSVQFSSVQSLSCVRLFATPRIAARQASLSITNPRSSPRLMSIDSVMPSSHLILCHPLLLLPPIPPSIRVFSNESTLRMRWPKSWSFGFSIIPSKEHPGLISFRNGLVGPPCSPRDSQESSPTPQFKSISSSVLSFLHSPTLTSIHDHWKNHSLD